VGAVEDYSMSREMLTVRRGVYLTTYGNAAYVSGPKAKTAWDLDMGERVPVSEITTTFLREAEPGDSGRG